MSDDPRYHRLRCRHDGCWRMVPVRGSGLCLLHGGEDRRSNQPVAEVAAAFVRMARHMTRQEIADDLGISRKRLDDVVRRARNDGRIPEELEAVQSGAELMLPTFLRNVDAQHPALVGEPACTGANPEDFYPLDFERVESWELRAHETARRYCDQCPVRNACLQWALEVGEPGLWGGTTDRDRRLLRRGKPIRERTTA